MSRLLRVFGLEKPLRDRLDAGMPTLSTCAGLILMSSDAALGTPLVAGSLCFGNQALNRYLGVSGGFGGGLLMDRELFGLNFPDSF